MLARRDETIDLGLARWANNPETLSTLFARWCGSPPGNYWAAQNTFAYPILCAILSNTSVVSLLFCQADSTDGISAEAFDWIVEHGDDELAKRMHSNDCVGLNLIRKCCRREGIYAAIPDQRWLQILVYLSESKRFKRPAIEYDDSPDMFHWDVHRGIVDAVRSAPKTLEASNFLWGVLNRIPSKVAYDAYVSSKDLIAVVDLWEVDIADGGAYSHHKDDALTAAERVQFNLLRLYGSSSDLDPNNERRIVRLAAYSKCYLSGSKGLKVEDFKKYSDRDGPAFVYAASFNPHIWQRPAAALAMSQGGFPSPEKSEYLHYNRPEYNEAPTAEYDAGSDVGSEVPPGIGAPHLLSTPDLYAQLSEQLKSLKGWVFWAALITVVAVKW
ncbi:hypothetical protein [Massilia sp. PWRC2]|uniref:hypothetical protein n=1 Tax=Massilia sp. PWRC2 TaxID=2804626 RepID=UPI003CEB9646